MKLKLFLIASVAILSLCVYGEEINSEGSTTIVLSTNPDKLGQLPRTPNSIPIECTYNYGILQLTFWDNLDIINITITNTTNGTYETKTINTINGYAIINVSQASGEYLLTITTLSETYYGYYILN